MSHLSIARGALSALAAVVLVACAPLPTPSGYESQPDQVAKREVEAALSRYESLLRRQDSAQIAGLFVQGGRLEHVGQEPVIGREKIQAFLASFASYKVLSHDMKLISSSAAPSHVSQSGTYVQRVRGPDGQEITVRGWFLFQWQRQQDGSWLIEHARTSSSPLGSGT